MRDKRPLGSFEVAMDAVQRGTGKVVKYFTYFDDLTCKRGSVGQSEGLSIPRSSVRFCLKPDNSNSHEFELHRPSNKGTKLLLKVIKATIIIRTRTSSERLHALPNEISMKSSRMEIHAVCTLTWNTTPRASLTKMVLQWMINLRSQSRQYVPRL